jgi:[citrate (pro-3S)-lyase] ligase
VEENESIFSFDVRFKLVKLATKHLKNVCIIPSTKYIISKATFPSYFLKDVNLHTQTFMDLDIRVFKTYFMETFHISKRYVGDEPLDPMTHLYNQTMKMILKDQLEIIPRLNFSDAVISASYVRKLAQQKDFDLIKKLVPQSTYDYLISEEGQSLWL